jgi:hypothetical protein
MSTRKLKFKAFKEVDNSIKYAKEAEELLITHSEEIEASRNKILETIEGESTLSTITKEKPVKLKKSKTPEERE